ncbi:hypothetical protein DIPPA_12007 [Diplonema papillatum]|nr:hypothetical protein DIPPA_12007 [Diplonema papillatum]|eukprot:gene2049-3138_t
MEAPEDEAKPPTDAAPGEAAATGPAGKEAPAATGDAGAAAVLVRHVPNAWERADAEAFFKGCGAIERVTVMPRKQMAFVTFASRAGLLKALELNLAKPEGAQLPLLIEETERMAKSNPAGKGANSGVKRRRPRGSKAPERPENAAAKRPAPGDEEGQPPQKKTRTDGESDKSPPVPEAAPPADKDGHVKESERGSAPAPTAAVAVPELPKELAAEDVLAAPSGRKREKKKDKKKERKDTLLSFANEDDE